MFFLIPAKTFLLGEYAALQGDSAIILTTPPYFKVEQLAKKELIQIHPQSPAGLFWAETNPPYGLAFHDPYQGIGGLGASSAQFVGVYLAYAALQKREWDIAHLLSNYYRYAWNGQGLCPSGYDVVAQTKADCVYINKKNQLFETYAWPFPDLTFILIHSGHKLPTHQHLEKLTSLQETAYLSSIVDKAKQAFQTRDSALFIKCIQDYQHQLIQLNLTASHTKNLIQELQQYPDIQAIKGCGALGADILLILTHTEKAQTTLNYLKNKYMVITMGNFSSPNIAIYTL